ncbi:MAG: SDR family oxidoreductase [Halieaceae bacterium]|jgi:short-subunit dehydrogenase|nr:SDR family oxidoreductase [Halieaceae bacterium]
MAKTALITGASAGIGEALAWVHAEKGGDLILVARRKERLDVLAAAITADHGVRVEVITADLSKPGAAKRLVAEVEERGLQVDILINNAGLGAHGAFHESALERQTTMLQVNITALTELTHLLVQGMVERGNGKVLNVGSTAGFLPGPLQAVYYATKAFVNSFSQAIANELEGTGVTVSVLCPGPVATEFQGVADMGGVKGFDFAADARSVAECGYRAMEKGRLVVVNDPKLRVLLEGIVPFIPRRPLLWMSRKTMEKSA